MYANGGGSVEGAIPSILGLFCKLISENIRFGQDLARLWLALEMILPRFSTTGNCRSAIFPADMPQIILH